MKSAKLKAAVVLTLAVVPLVSFAQSVEPAAVEDDSPISWTLAATSDYVFRGVSQSDENPAAQASITYTTPVGIYAGVWASNVDFGSGGPDIEYDTYVGYNIDVSEAVNFDVMLNRYNYEGSADDSALAYNELITKTTFLGNYSATIAYTNDFFGSSEESWYYVLAAGVDLPNDFTLGFSAAHTTIDESLPFDDYSDYSVSLGKSWGALSASLAYIDTDSHGEVNFGRLAGDRAVLTFTYSP
jgi:uncharacterized protein (TIGR02001 family)